MPPASAAGPGLRLLFAALFPKQKVTGLQLLVAASGAQVRQSGSSGIRIRSPKQFGSSPHAGPADRPNGSQESHGRLNAPRGPRKGGSNSGHGRPSPTSSPAPLQRVTSHGSSSPPPHQRGLGGASPSPVLPRSRTPSQGRDQNDWTHQSGRGFVRSMSPDPPSYGRRSRGHSSSSVEPPQQPRWSAPRSSPPVRRFAPSPPRAWHATREQPAQAEPSPGEVARERLYRNAATRNSVPDKYRTLLANQRIPATGVHDGARDTAVRLQQRQTGQAAYHSKKVAEGPPPVPAVDTLRASGSWGRSPPQKPAADADAAGAGA